MRSRCTPTEAAPRLAETGSAPLASSPANPLRGKFSVALDPIPNHKMPQFMPNDPQCRVAIREHAGREVDPPNRQAGVGECGPVGVKSVPRLQEFPVLEDDKSHRLIGIGELTKLIG